MDNTDEKKAVALRYNPETEDAPVVVAKGKGFLAERIKEIARESGVSLKEDKQLTDYLMSLDLYEEIPPQLYAVVAEVLVFIYGMDRKYQQGN